MVPDGPKERWEGAWAVEVIYLWVRLGVRYVCCILGIKRKIYIWVLIYKDDEGLRGLASGQLPYTKNASSAFHQSEFCGSNTTQSSSRAWQVPTENILRSTFLHIIDRFSTLRSRTLQTQYASHFHSLLNYIHDR
jgi:hypothetical protein